jgi:hypothetical protein
MPTEVELIQIEASQVTLVELDPTQPSIEVALVAGSNTKIKRWNGSAWVEINPGTIYIVRTGDPNPPAVTNDLIIQQNPT